MLSIVNISVLFLSFVMSSGLLLIAKIHYLICMTTRVKCFSDLLFFFLLLFFNWWFFLVSIDTDFPNSHFLSYSFAATLIMLQWTFAYLSLCVTRILGSLRMRHKLHDLIETPSNIAAVAVASISPTPHTPRISASLPTLRTLAVPYQPSLTSASATTTKSPTSSSPKHFCPPTSTPSDFSLKWMLTLPYLTCSGGLLLEHLLLSFNSVQPYRHGYIDFLFSYALYSRSPLIPFSSFIEKYYLLFYLSHSLSMILYPSPAILSLSIPIPILPVSYTRSPTCSLAHYYTL